MSPLASGVLGVVLGAAVVTVFLWLPMLVRYRQRLEDIRETFRIQSGLRPAGDVELDDAEGAFVQAQAAYVAVYPGRGEQPDPAWWAWVQSPVGPSEPIQAGVAEIYRPLHLTVDDEPTGVLTAAAHEEIDELAAPSRPTILQTWDAPDDRFPVWGKDGARHASSTPTPVGWVLTWRDWLLIPLALLLALLPARRTRYPWYQVAVDRVWEAGVVFEISAQRVNGAVLRGLDDLLIGLQGSWWEASEAVYEVWWDLISWPRRMCSQWPRRQRPGIRPKRYYPIKEA